MKCVLFCSEMKCLVVLLSYVSHTKRSALNGIYLTKITLYRLHCDLLPKKGEM